LSAADRTRRPPDWKFGSCTNLSIRIHNLLPVREFATLLRFFV
jgi:hypothetical protein